VVLLDKRASEGVAEMKGKESRHVQMRGIIITALAFAVMVLVLVFALSQVDERSEQQQAKALENAIMRATLTCYAVEGRYPATVRYLKENYGVVYNEDKYIVVIDSFGNMLPDIRVLTVGGGSLDEE